MHNNVLSKNYISSRSSINAVSELNVYSSINLQNKKDINIFINSLAIIFQANCDVNMKKVEDIFVSQLNQLGIYDPATAKDFFNTTVKNNKRKYFMSIGQHVLTENIHYVGYNKDIIGINPEEINLINNLESYINSFENLLKDDCASLSAVTEFLIKHYIDNQNADYNVETAHLLFSYYNRNFVFKQNLLDFFIDYSCSNFFRYKSDQKYQLLEKFILPFLTIHINLIDKNILGNFLLNFLPNNRTNDNFFNFSFLRKLIDLFMLHYPKDKKDLFIKLINSCLIKKQYYYLEFLLEILNKNFILIQQDDALLNNVELKEIFEKFINFLSINNIEIYACKKIIRSIEIFHVKLGCELFNLLLNKIQESIIIKIKHNFRYQDVIQDILNKYSSIITKKNIEDFIVTLSSIDQNRNIIDEYRARNLLKTYRIMFSYEEIVKLNINLINNCLSTNDVDYIVFIKDLLIEVLELDKLLGHDLINYLLNEIKNNLNDMNVILFHNYIIKYYLKNGDIDLNLFKNIVNYIIKMKAYSEFDKFVAIKDILNIIIMNNKNPKDKIIKFIELSIMDDCLLAIQLSKEYKTIINENNSKQLIKKAIIKFIEIGYREANPFYLLLDNLDLWTDVDKYLLSKLIINKNLSFVNESDFLGFDNDNKFENILTIINYEDFKNCLLLFDRDFFISLFSQILNNYKDDLQKIQEIVNRYQNFITAQQIEMVYFSTNTLYIANYIRTIQYRYQLELPIRNDIRTVHFARNILSFGSNNNRLRNGNTDNAFHVHDYTNGAEKSVLSIINFLLYSKKIKVNSINKTEFIDNYVNKYINLAEDQNKPIINVLNNLQKDIQYSEKFANILPYIVTFLENDSEDWFIDYKDKLLRWNIYLQSSFIESSQAYNKKIMSNNISCIKGVYERFFIPFRFLHPSFKALFVNQDVVNAFDYNISNELLLLNDIVLEKMSKLYINNTSIKIIENINEIFITEFINKFNATMDKTKDVALSLNPYHELFPIIDKELKRNSIIVTNFLDKITGNIQNYLESIFINDLNIYEYIESKLQQIPF